LARLNPDGTPDDTFGDGLGKLTADFGTPHQAAYDVLLQPDGKIVVAGVAANSISLRGDFALARFDSDGTPDTSFDGTGKSWRLDRRMG
jgi:uncharacterized delta-60 repeat protein